MKIGNVLLPIVWLAFLIWPSAVVPAEVPQVDAEQALVVFYRPQKMGGAAITYNVLHAGGTLGVLNNGTVLHGYFAPGQHQFWAQVVNQDSITLNVEAGKTYFVRGDVVMGLRVGRPKFTARLPCSSGRR